MKIFFRRLSVKHKLTAIILSICLLILLLTFSVAFLNQSYLYKQNTLEELQTLAKIIGENCTAALLFQDEGALQQTLKSLAQKNSILKAQILNPDDSIVAEYSRIDGEKPNHHLLGDPDLQQQGYLLHDTHIDLLHPIVLDGEKIGLLYLQASMHDLKQNLSKAAVYLLLIICGGLIIAVLLANRLQNIITGPVLQLAGAIQQVSQEKNYHLRVDQNSEDEIGQLAVGFNDMLGQIQQRDEDLEEQVADRTRELESSEKQWSDAFNAVSSPIFLHNNEGQIIKANRAYLDQADCSLEDAVGCHYWELFPKQEPPLSGGLVNEQQDFPFCLEEISTEDGISVYRTRSFVVRDQQGGYLYAMHLMEDVTEREKYIEKLQRFEQILSTATDLMAFFDDKHTYLSANAIYADYFNTTQDEIVGKPAPEIIGEKRYNAYLEHHDRVFNKGETVTFSEWIDYPGRGKRFMDITFTPYIEADGRITGVVVSSTDMTEKVEQEARLRLSAKVFESTTEGIIITDREGGILAVNKAFSRITGHAEAEVIGQNPRIVKSGRHDEAFYQQMWQELSETGQWRGEIWNRRKDGEVYPELLTISSIKNDEDETINYVAVFSDITSLKEAAERLEYQAHHHFLTGLPNRLLLHARLEHSIQHAKRENEQGAVLFLDLDDFKKINDSLGHNAGDEILKSVARRLQKHIREVDTVSHLGGDEFVLVLQKIRTIQDVMTRAQDILDSLQKPFRVDDYELYVSGSIGIAEFSGDSEDIEVLLKNADAAMYKAKEGGKNCYQLYSPELTDAAIEKVLLESHLRRAMERNELVLHYQPQLALPEGRIVAMEALVRWQHPDIGLVPPDKFIPLSEETGLIIAMGEWILKTACEQLMLWREQGYGMRRIAVNLSGRQLQLKSLPQVVEKILLETGCPSSSLELEITEGFIMRHPEQAISVLQQIRDLGVELSVDDFGTGHSSLNYLKRLPINRLKIDRSFVWDIGENADGETITRAIIAMGHSLNLQITAEGVETPEQRLFLEGQGCNEAQGYLFSKPLPAEEITKLFKKNVKQKAVGAA